MLESDITSKGQVTLPKVVMKVSWVCENRATVSDIHYMMEK